MSRCTELKPLQILSTCFDINYSLVVLQFLFLWHFDPIPGHGLPLRGFTIKLIRHNTFGRTPLDKWSVRCRDLYMTTHNTHRGQTSMQPAGFEPAILAQERQTHTLDCAATGIDCPEIRRYIIPSVHDDK